MSAEKLRMRIINIAKINLGAINLDEQEASAAALVGGKFYPRKNLHKISRIREKVSRARLGAASLNRALHLLCGSYQRGT